MSDYTEEEYFAPILNDEFTIERLKDALSQEAGIHKFLMEEADIPNSMTFSFESGMKIIFEKGKSHYELWSELKKENKKLEEENRRLRKFLYDLADMIRVGDEDYACREITTWHREQSND